MEKAVLEAFCKKYCVSKDALLQKIDDFREMIRETREKDVFHWSRDYELLEKKVIEFYTKVESSVLPCGFEGLWGLDFRISYSAIELLFCHYDVDECNTGYYFTMDQRYVLFSLGFKLLSVKEYASRYGIEPVTVRQWIRRGKLRAVVKHGSEWFISELADFPLGCRRYETSTYCWSEDVNFNEEHGYLNCFDEVTIQQDPNDKGLYILKFINTQDDACGKTHTCSAREREKLELYLLAHPKVRCCIFPCWV